MHDIWREIPLGTIVDSDISRLAAASELIVDGFDPDRVKQACYELTASDIFYNLQSAAENKRVVVDASTGYLLKPNCYVVSIVKERLRLPSNVLGRILTKGKLFSVGILPVNTYADPGFEGRLGLSLYNGSQRYVVVRPGEAIAKIEFSMLPKPVMRPYSGQHGYETEIWPVATNLYADLAGEKVASRIGSDEEELALSHGPLVAEMFRQLRFYRYGVWAQLFVILAGFGILFALHGYVSMVWSLALGILSNLLTMVAVNIVFRNVKRP